MAEAQTQSDDPWFDQFNQPQVQAPTAPPPTPGVSGMGPGGTPPLAPTGGQYWDQNYFSTNFGTPKTPQELIALEAKITAAGGKVLRNAAGVAGKIQTPDGRII